MSIIDKARDQNFENLQALADAEERARRAEEDRDRQLAALIFAKMQELAGSLGEDLEVIKDGSVFRLGDVVLLVRLHGLVGRPDPADPLEARRSYQVRLAGCDLGGKGLQAFLVGTLQYTTGERIVQAVAETYGRYELDAATVLERHRDRVCAL